LDIFRGKQNTDTLWRRRTKLRKTVWRSKIQQPIAIDRNDDEKKKRVRKRKRGER